MRQWGGMAAGYLVESSNICGHPEGSRWPGRLVGALAIRRQDGGEHKGRVLYAFQIRWPTQGRLTVGALAYHLEDRMIRILQVGTTSDKEGIRALQIITLLVLCAQEIARLHGCNRLEWLVSNEPTARDACTNHGFRRVRKSDRRQRGLRGRILLERFLV